MYFTSCTPVNCKVDCFVYDLVWMSYKHTIIFPWRNLGLNCVKVKFSFFQFLIAFSRCCSDEYLTWRDWCQTGTWWRDWHYTKRVDRVTDIAHRWLMAWLTFTPTGDGLTDITDRQLVAWLTSRTDDWWRDRRHTQTVDVETDITHGRLIWNRFRRYWQDYEVVILRWVLDTAKRRIQSMKVITDVACGYYSTSSNKLSFAWSLLF